MKKTGNVWKFGDDIDTDIIIAARYLNTSDPEELAKHCMEDSDPNFSNKIKKDDIIVGGKNFGCGSSREHAPIAIKAAGISCVIAKTFARIFYRNSFNMGLAILECNDVDKFKQGDLVTVDFDNGEIISGNESYFTKPIPPFMQELIKSNGLIPYTTKKMLS